MKILSRMMKKSKQRPEDGMSEIDFDELSELSGGKPQATTDDSGRPNSSRTPSVAGGLSAPGDDLQPMAEEEPEDAADEWGARSWDDDDWDDDEDWGDEDFDDEDTRRELKASQDKAHLVGEIRDAMVSVGEPSAASDRVDQKVDAAQQLTENDSEDRIMEVTETAMTDRETSRRRSAMAHLKAAAAATKADRVLSKVRSRDPSGDPEEQSPYRDDLAKVVRPHQPNSRPISRQVSQPQTQQAIWDQGEGDEDAALYAASTDEGAVDPAIESELAEAEAERLARAPLDLSEEDFSDDSFLSDRFASDDGSKGDWGNDRFASDDDDRNVFSENESEFEEPEDDSAPRPSSVVSEAVAFANAPDEESEPDIDDGQVRKKIWEMTDEVASSVDEVRKRSEPIVNVAPAVAGRAGRSAGRVKTRMLGFQAEQDSSDVFEDSTAPAEGDEVSHFPAGWIIVVEGPGRGACFTLHNGVSQIGRGEEQAVRLDFGDTSISRKNHAAVAYDDEQGKFFLGHGGKSNLVRLNGQPVLSTEELTDRDVIRIGETTLKFVALCSDEFTWTALEGETTADE